MNQEALPIVRLRPNAEARAIRHGFPWAYDNEIVADRRTRKLAPGSFAILEDNARMPLGLVTINPQSRIMARMMDRDPEAVIDRSWLDGRLSRALSLRERLYDTPHYRLVHAEADGLPGLVIDRFGDTLSIQPNAAWTDRMVDVISDVAASLSGAAHVCLNAGGRARKAEGLGEVGRILQGQIDAPVPVPMNGATYLADLLGGQKTGLFFDQRENHASAARYVNGGERVLDVFSHVGGFALAMLAAGAGHALAVDGSEAALDLASAGATASGVLDRFQARRGDAFDVMSELAEAGEKFDIVVCDPPAFAPSKQALQGGLRAYERVARAAAALVEPGGFLVLCSCSHAADLIRFRQASVRGIGRAGRSAQLLQTGFAGPDHPQHPMLAESGYLKALFFRLE